MQFHFDAQPYAYLTFLSFHLHHYVAQEDGSEAVSIYQVSGTPMGMEELLLLVLFLFVHSFCLKV